MNEGLYLDTLCEALSWPAVCSVRPLRQSRDHFSFKYENRRNFIIIQNIKHVLHHYLNDLQVSIHHIYHDGTKHPVTKMWSNLDRYKHNRQCLCVNIGQKCICTSLVKNRICDTCEYLFPLQLLWCDRRVSVSNISDQYNIGPQNNLICLGGSS